MKHQQSVPETRPLAGSISSAARLIGVSRTTFYKLIKSGAITPVTVFGRRLVRYSDLQSFLDRQIANAS